MSLNGTLMHLRLKHGLHWRGKYPPVPWRHVINLTAVIALYALASSLDYYLGAAQAATQAAQVFEAQARVLRDCERGATGYYYPDGRTFQCGAKL